MPGFLLIVAWIELTIVAGNLAVGRVHPGMFLLLGLAAYFKLSSERDYRNRK